MTLPIQNAAETVESVWEIDDLYASTMRFESRRRIADQIDDDLFSEMAADTPWDGIEDVLSEPALDRSLALIAPRPSVEAAEAALSERRSSSFFTKRLTGRHTDQKVERASFKRISFPRSSGSFGQRHSANFSSCLQDRPSSSRLGGRGDDPLVAGVSSLLRSLRNDDCDSPPNVCNGDPLGMLSELPSDLLSRGPSASQYGIPRMPNRMPNYTAKEWQSLGSSAQLPAWHSRSENPHSTIPCDVSSVSTDADYTVLGGVSHTTTVLSLEDHKTETSWQSLQSLEGALDETFGNAQEPPTVLSEFQVGTHMPAPPLTVNPNRSFRRWQHDNVRRVD